MGKIITKEQYLLMKPVLADKKVGLCHGVFDLVHPGHLIHFKEAKSVCDVLVVSVTAAKYVRKGPDRPYFDDTMRLEFLEAIECIDFVMLSEGFTPDDIIGCVEPDLYIKGEEYSVPKDDVTGMIDKEAALVRQHGGDIYYTTGQVFSSTKLINKGLSALSQKVMDFSGNFTKRYSMETVKRYSESAKKLKVLVIGDVIMDKYTYCTIQGLMSKDMGYSARYQKKEEYFGGSAAIARQLAVFSDNVTLCSVTGDEKKIYKRFSDELGSLIELELVQSHKIPTIVKHRYLEKDKKRNDLRKILAINNIPEVMERDKAAEGQFLEKIVKITGGFDVVFVCDYGHGLINQNVMSVIQDKAKCLVLNCQTNSTNYGLNIITKYSRADFFTLDQKELKLAYPYYNISEKEALAELARHLNGKGWLTRGSSGAYGIDGSKILECPAFVLDVVDTIGAGDAFFSVAGLFSAAGAPVELGMFMGNIAGALASNITGNKYSIEKADILKYAGTLLNI